MGAQTPSGFHGNFRKLKVLAGDPLVSFLVSGNSRTRVQRPTNSHWSLCSARTCRIESRPPALSHVRTTPTLSAAAAAWIFLRQHSRAKHEGVCGLGGVAFGAGRGRWLRRDVSHYKKQARGRCLPSGRGLSGRLWGALGCSGATRDRLGPLGTARDPRDRSGPRPRSGARLGHLRPASGWLGCTAGRRGGAAV